MNASKEQAQRILDILQRIENNDCILLREQLTTIKEFVELAKKRLPGEAAIQKDTDRKRDYNDRRKRRKEEIERNKEPDYRDQPSASVSL